MSRAVAWTCLLVVASTSGYAFQAVAGAMFSSASAHPLHGRDQVPDGGRVHGQSVSVIDAVAAPTHTILITSLDASAGGRTQVECETGSDRLASDTLLVDLGDFDTVAAQLCSDGATEDTSVAAVRHVTSP
jgi:hypothetical protein